MLKRSLPALVALLGAAAVSMPTPPVAPSHSSLSFFSTASFSQATGGGYTPQQINTAYNFTPLISNGIDGTGQKIALIELDKFNPSDLSQFDSSNQLPNPSIQQAYIGGKKFKLSSGGETTLDLEWAHALAPGATVLIYYIKNNQPDPLGWKTLAQAVTTAVKNGAGTISMSFGTCTASSGHKKTETALTSARKKGVSVFVSSGDSGAHAGPKHDCGTRIGVAYPASDPSVVSVGGTSLLLNNDDTISQEVAWSSSGGGKGSPLLRPVWQVIAQLKNAKYRWSPDVAFLADPRTGAEVYFKGRWQQAGGTSLGAPSWAALWALIRQDAVKTGKSLGTAPPLLYSVANSSQYAQAFHDITTGDNGYYQATVGWDPLTGWGTPDASGLATALLSQ